MTLQYSWGNAIGVNGYDAYGIPNETNIGRFQYTGQIWLAELGLYYYKARIYSPTLGRFLQTDPIGYEDQYNLYAYVGNDPVNLVDPTGEFSELAGAFSFCTNVGGCAPSGSSASSENSLEDNNEAINDNLVERDLNNKKKGNDIICAILLTCGQPADKAPDSQTGEVDQTERNPTRRNPRPNETRQPQDEQTRRAPAEQPKPKQKPKPPSVGEVAIRVAVLPIYIICFAVGICHPAPAQY